MQSKISPTLIGAFALATLILGIAAVFILSSGSLGEKSMQFILFFEGNVKGLQVGSPVNFRGVKIGHVESMSITYFEEPQKFRIPVIISIEDSQLEVNGVITDENDPLELDHLIKQGLRARLNLQSLVTGKLEVELDFQPDTPIRLVNEDDRYPEIPTVQSGMEKLATAIEQIPIERITQRVSGILDSIDKMLADGDVKRAIDSLVVASERLNQITQLLAQEAPVLLENSNATLTEAQLMLKEVSRTAIHTQTFIATTEQNLSGAFASWDKTMVSGDQAFTQVSKVADSADRILSQDSEVMTQMNLALRELGAAARSIRNMSEYLERHPEALIQGKQ
ncbi:MAG: MlaD family protein [Candidatus Thiodiazotropha sp.]|jgi:paraquat-inducible protein B